MKSLKPLFANLISWGRATLHELRTIYSLQDAYAIWEAEYVPRYNNYCRDLKRAEMAKLKKML